MSANLKRKISLLCDVSTDAVVSAIDAENIYEIPLALHEEGLDDIVCRILRLDEPGRQIDLSSWEALVNRVSAASEVVHIGIIGKYVNLPDAYLSVVEALKHAGFHHGAKVEIDWVQAEEVTGMLAPARLDGLDGIVIPGGFGERGLEGKIAAAGYAREHAIPCLGLCLGLHMMVVDFARNIAGLEGANSRELDASTPYAVIDLMDDQIGIEKKGATMRLGAYVAKLEPGSQVAAIYGSEIVSERHRHRYEVNNTYRPRLVAAGLSCSGTSPDDRLVEYIELPGHPYWIATQAHPEFKSRPDRPHPLFRGLVGAALNRAHERTPRLYDLDNVPS
jgi:CTP synthase